MTLALGTTDCAFGLDDPGQLVRCVISSAEFGVPAVALTDPALAAWVRGHGVTVTAHDDQELELLQHSGFRPTQVVYRCG